MSVTLLDATARLILRQRLIEADEARIAKRVCTRHRTHRKPRQTIIAGRLNGLAVSTVTDELTRSHHRDLAASK